MTIAMPNLIPRSFVVVHCCTALLPCNVHDTECRATMKYLVLQLLSHDLTVGLNDLVPDFHKHPEREVSLRHRQRHFLDVVGLTSNETLYRVVSIDLLSVHLADELLDDFAKRRPVARPLSGLEHRRRSTVNLTDVHVSLPRCLLIPDHF